MRIALEDCLKNLTEIIFYIYINKQSNKKHHKDRFII